MSFSLASDLRALPADIAAKFPWHLTSTIPGLYPSVVAAIPTVFAKWEGQALPYMYTDSKGYVTTGTGNLIDPVGTALALPWTNPDGSPTSQADIEAAFNAVKGAYPGVQSTGSQSLTSIRLSPQALDDLMLKTISANQTILLERYSNFATIPADAQLGIHSISWAWGSGFDSVWGDNGVAFKNAIANRDFTSAGQIMSAASQHEESINPGIVPRDQGNLVMFANAAKNKLEPSKLYYPGTVGAPWGTMLLGLAGGVGGFLLGGPVGAAVGAGAVLGGGHVAKAGMPALKLPHISIPGLHIGPVDPKAVQTKLNSLGYTPPLTVDGAIGPLSQTAIMWFQASQGLPQTGQVDSATRKALGV